MYCVALRCGTVLTYEFRSLVPAGGETVPCRNHGYCSVDGAVGRTGHTGSDRPAPRRSRRSQSELVAFLRDYPVTTVHVLRRCQFPLRMVAAAHKEGLLEVDLPAGTVQLRRERASGAGESTTRLHAGWSLDVAPASFDVQDSIAEDR